MKLVPIGDNLYHIELEAGERAEIAAQRLEQKTDAQGLVGSITFVTLAENGVIDDVTAGEHAELFAPWEPAVAYELGQLRQYLGQLYRCLQAHTSQPDWSPDVTHSLWTPVADPSDPWPEWAQPIGAHDAYAAGDHVTHLGKHWASTVDGNVWEPGVYGWTEVP